MALRINLLKKLEDLECRQMMDIAQKSRICWDVEWDENSKLFHGMLRWRRRKQAIKGIMFEGNWC